MWRQPVDGVRVKCAYLVDDDPRMLARAIRHERCRRAVLRKRNGPPRRPDTALVAVADPASFAESQVRLDVTETVLRMVAVDHHHVHRLAVETQAPVIGWGKAR